MLESKIQADTLQAMKDSDKFKVSVLRMLKSAIQSEKINLKHDLSDDEIILVTKKQVKLRNDSISEYKKYNREDLISDLEKEIEILSIYLPSMLSEEEILKNIDAVIANYPGATIKDMGKIMKELQTLIGTRADMSEVSKIIKSKLS